MPADTRRVAVVLHGPPTAGKSQVGQEIQGRYESERVELISLDAGWAPGERRHTGGRGRYEDLRNAQAPILILELACGEPTDLSFRGATRGAQEWVSVLQDSGRLVFPFLLWLEWPDAVERVMNRWNGHPHLLQGVANQLGFYAFYEHLEAIVTFPQIVGFTEERIMTSGRVIPEITDDILRRCGS